MDLWMARGSITTPKKFEGPVYFLGVIGDPGVLKTKEQSDTGPSASKVILRNALICQ